MHDASRRGKPAPPACPVSGRDRAPAPVTPRPETTTPAATLQRGWWGFWWAPLVQLVALSAIVISAAVFIDVRNREVAADLAAERGAGARVTVTRPAPRHAAPVALRIARLGVRSALVDLRKNPDGTVQVPTDFGLAGWYVGSAHPGDAGPTVLIGHVDSKKGPGIFYRVNELHKGDRIVVQRADRTQAVYVVQYVKRFAKRSFPTALVYAGDGKPSLRLVTCGGQFDRRTGHYLDNTVVFAAPLVSARKPAPPAPSAHRVSRSAGPVAGRK